MHFGYLDDKDILDTTIFVKENDRSYLAIAIFQGKMKSVFKKDKDKLYKRLSNPMTMTSSWVKNFISSNTVLKRFDQNAQTRELGEYLKEFSNE
jgi:hypothetical protein